MHLQSLSLSLSLSLSATVFNNANQQINVYGDDVEVDYRGYEVTFLSSDWSILEHTHCNKFYRLLLRIFFVC